MDQLLERAMVEAQSLPDKRQGEVAEMVLALVEQEASHLSLSAAQRDEVRRRMSEDQNLVPEAEMKTFFRKLAE